MVPLPRPPPLPVRADMTMVGDDPDVPTGASDHAETFAALERIGVGDDVLAGVRHYLNGVRSGDQFAYDLGVVPYLPPEHLERHMRDVLDRVRKRPGMFRGDGPDGLREGAALLDEEAERVRGWLAVVARRQGVGEPNLDGVMATGETSIAGLNELASEWRTAEYQAS